MYFDKEIENITIYKDEKRTGMEKKNILQSLGAGPSSGSRKTIDSARNSVQFGIKLKSMAKS
jgi:hypothetical protein